VSLAGIQALGDTGDAVQAEAVAEKLIGCFRGTPSTEVILPVIRSSATPERNAVKAVDLLASVTQYPKVWFLHRGRLTCAGEHAKAAPIFRETHHHRGWPEWNVCSAGPTRSRAGLCHARTARTAQAYDASSPLGKTRTGYPILRQAKAEYRNSPQPQLPPLQRHGKAIVQLLKYPPWMESSEI